MSDYLDRLRATLPQRTAQCPRCGDEVRTREDGSDATCLHCTMREALKGCSVAELDALRVRAEGALKSR